MQVENQTTTHNFMSRILYLGEAVRDFILCDL